MIKAEPAPVSPPEPPKKALPPLEFGLRAHRLRLEGGSALAIAALEALQALRDDLRGKRYKAAKKAAISAAALLAELSEAMQESELRELLGPAFAKARFQQPQGEAHPSPDPWGWLAAIEALEAHEGSREHRAEALREALAPAFGQPLTTPEAHNALAVLHALLGEHEAARAELERALALDAGHYRALTNLGNLELEQGDPAAAEATYRRALALHDYGSAHHNLAVALRRQNKRHASVKALKKGQRLSLREAKEREKGEPLPKVSPLLVAVILLALLGLWLLLR